MGKGKDLCLLQIYFDYIIFGSTNYELCKEFSDLKGNEFEMGLLGELNFFLGLLIKQCKEGYKVQMKSISGPGDFQPFIPKETDFTSSSEKGWDNHSISSRDRRLKNFVTIPLIFWFLVVSLGA